MLKKSLGFIGLLAMVALLAVPVLYTPAAHAQQLSDYTNLTVTSSVDLADEIVGLVFAQIRAYAPFAVQLGFAIALLAIVAALVFVVWRLATGWIHKLGHKQ